MEASADLKPVRSVKWLLALPSEKNVADRLTDAELSRLGQEVVRSFQMDLNARADWDRLSESAMKLAQQVKEEKNFPWPKASNVKHPLITVAAIQFAARAYPEIIKGNKVVRCQITGNEPKLPQAPMPPAAIPPQGPLQGPPQGPPPGPAMAAGGPPPGPGQAPPMPGPPGPMQGLAPGGPQAGMPPVAPQPAPPKKSPKRERADRIETHMNWQLTQEMPEWDEGMDRLLHVLPVIGTCYKKSYFSPGEGRNISEIVLPSDCVVNAKATSLPKARRITHRIWLYSNDVMERVRQHLWLDAGDLSHYPVDAAETEDQDAAMEFLEQHRYEDLDGDGYKEPYIITVHKQSAKVVQIKARWQLDKVKTEAHKGSQRVTGIEPDHYFTHFGFIPNPDGSLNYLGFGQLLEPINASANAILNQLIDAGTRSNAGGGFIGRGAKLRGGTYAFRPGEWKMVDVAGGALRDNLVPAPINEPSAVLFQLLGFLVQAGKEISSVQDVLTGDAHLAANMPVGTMMALVEQGLKVYTAIYKRVYRSLSEEYKKLYKLNGIFLDPQFTFIISGKPDEFTVGQKDYEVDDLTVVPVADPDLSSDMQRLLKSQALKDLTGRPGINEVEITRRCVRAIHPEDVDEVLLSDEQIAGKTPLPWKPPPHPQLILAQAKAQRLTQQAQEAGVRLQMDMAKFELEVEALTTDIAKKKADTMLSLAKAEREDVGKHLDTYRLEIDKMAKEVETKVGLIKEGIKLYANGLKSGNQPAGMAGLGEGPPDSGGLQSGPV